MSQTSILYTNADSTVLILDIPKSIEQAQGSLFKRRVLSSPPLEKPYPSLEPKSAKARAKFPESEIEELLLQRHIQLALEEVREVFLGDWCGERVVGRDEEGRSEADGRMKGRKRRKVDFEPEDEAEVQGPSSFTPWHGDSPEAPAFFFQNTTSSPNTILISSSQSPTIIPPDSTILLGSITATLPIFHTQAPTFPLIILDPPWPNRSARRSKHYTTSHSNPDIHSLLHSLLLKEKLADDGVIAVWVTNRRAFREILLGENGVGGLFEVWGVRLVEEWVWVKVTKSGELVGGLDDVWRKPWEVLLVGRKDISESRNVGGNGTAELKGNVEGWVTRRIIFGVPDLHSRKPNLKEVMERCLGVGGLGKERVEGRYEGLEVFARNMTEGWWSWGDEACKFQGEGYLGEESEKE